MSGRTPAQGAPPTLHAVRQAAAVLKGVANRTPVVTSRTLNAMVGATVFLKCESFQRSGSFKFRGAYNALSRLSASERERGVVTYSSGNHAQAIALARAVGYHSAGTVELIVSGADPTGESFYFLEMNTRLQVEHPVTEWITGLDLVAEQLRIAEGEPLGYEQSDLAIHGHAVESRVYAEDVAAGFLPAPGPLLRHTAPSGFGVRVDAGVEQGDEIPIHYDPMVSKLTAWGRTRAEAIARMDRALAEYDVAGVETTIPFCRFVMQHEAFRSGRFDTGFIAEHFAPEHLAPDDPELARAAAIVAVLLGQGQTNGRADERQSGRTAERTNGRADESRWARRRWS